jgi:hypothetical protein
LRESPTLAGYSSLQAAAIPPLRQQQQQQLKLSLLPMKFALQLPTLQLLISLSFKVL